MVIKNFSDKNTKNNILSKLVLLLITLTILFLFLETCTRIAVYFNNNNNNFKKVIQNLSELKRGKIVTLGEIIQPSKYTKIIYELRPNISVYYQNVLVGTNSQGWRNKACKVYKENNKIRIIGLGDSFMFGYGISQDETALSFLEKELNARFPQKVWEVINTAVPGYNTVMEVETLEKKALIYKPDIVIMENIGNDFDLPNFIYKPNDNLNIAKSFFIDFLLRRLHLLKENFELIDAPIASYRPTRFEYDPRLVPEAYKDMVGWEGFAKAMIKLKEIQKKNNFEVIIFITRSYLDERIFTFCNSLGFFAICNFLNISDPSLVFSEKDHHPTALQNKKTADNLFNSLIKYNIVQKYLEKKI